MLNLLTGRALAVCVRGVRRSFDTPARGCLYSPVGSDSNTALYQVTSNTESSKSRRHAPLARTLAFVLLAFVAYTTTAESVHRHGRLALVSSESSAAAVAPSGRAGSSVNDSPAIGDCLICQLRQNLSFSLLSALPQLVAPQSQTELSRAVALLSISRLEAPRRGRAPPITSLS